MYRAKVAVLGPEGSFSEEVVRKRFAMDNVELIYTDRFGEIFDLIDIGEADAGVVPIEDSVDGDIGESLDLLERYDVYIIAELHLKVECALLGKEDVSGLKEICSHYKLLNVCQNYLDFRFPNLSRRKVQSTSDAARLAATNPTIGAIANEEIASRYGLKVLAREVHDHGYHTTRFLVLAESPLDWDPSEDVRKRATKLVGNVYFTRELNGKFNSYYEIF